MTAARVLILGCGYTGTRVARRLMEEGHEVIATARDVSKLDWLRSVNLAVDVGNAESLSVVDSWVNKDTLVLFSLPSIGSSDLTPLVLPHVARARRVLYLSTTGVYGGQRDVDEQTETGPRSEREWLRFDAEQSIAAAFANSLILRPAAIYGPHRGIHSAMLAGTYRLSEAGSNYVSRIHVDDLASHCIAGLFSDVTGAWPVADEDPCTSAEIAAFCAGLLQIPMPLAVTTQELSETRRADRRVDGSAIRRALNIDLQFPSYRVGIPACIAAESKPESEPADAVDRAF